MFELMKYKYVDNIIIIISLPRASIITSIKITHFRKNKKNKKILTRNFF